MERAWKDLPLRAKGLVVIAIPLACFVVAAALFTVTLAQVRQAQARVLHTVEVERQVSQLRILLQSSVTGFVLTGQERYLASYEANARSLPLALARLRELVSDNPGQRQRLQQVGVLADRRQRILAELVASVRANSPPRTVPVADEPRAAHPAQRHPRVHPAIEAGRLPLSLEPVAVADVADETVSLIRRWPTSTASCWPARPSAAATTSSATASASSRSC